MNERLIISIDPGVTGAIARRFGPDDWEVYDMPVEFRKINGKNRKQVDVAALRKILDEYDGDCWVEDVHSMPKQGSVSTFGFGRSLGAAEASCAGESNTLSLVRPQEWQKYTRVGTGKRASREAAAKLTGNAKLFARVKDDGRADAVLIAQYGYMKMKGKIK